MMGSWPDFRDEIWTADGKLSASSHSPKVKETYLFIKIIQNDPKNRPCGKSGWIIYLGNSYRF